MNVRVSRSCRSPFSGTRGTGAYSLQPALEQALDVLPAASFGYMAIEAAERDSSLYRAFNTCELIGLSRHAQSVQM